MPQMAQRSLSRSRTLRRVFFHPCRAYFSRARIGSRTAHSRRASSLTAKGTRAGVPFCRGGRRRGVLNGQGVKAHLESMAHDHEGLCAACDKTRSRSLNPEPGRGDGGNLALS